MLKLLVNARNKKCWSKYQKVQKSEQMKIHELSNTPERKPASVDAKLAETSILSGSPTGCIYVPQAGCSYASVTNGKSVRQPKKE